MRSIILILAVLLALAGCSASTGGQIAAPSSEMVAPTSTVSAAPSPPSTTTAPPAPADGSDVRACYDGNCEIAVSGLVMIPLDIAKFNYSALEVVSIGQDTLRYQVYYSPGQIGSVVDTAPGGGGSFGYRSLPTIHVDVVTIREGTGVLRLSTS